MTKTKFNGVEDVIKKLEAMGKGIEPSMVRGIIEDALEPVVFKVQAGVQAYGLPASTYGFIRKNDGKFITNKRVSMLVGVNSQDPDAYKVNWMEYGTAPRYTKDGYYRGQVTPHPVIRPVIDTHSTQVEKNVEDALFDEIMKLAKQHGF